MAIHSDLLETINVALSRLGQRPLAASDLTSPTGKIAVLVDGSLQFHLDALVDDHPWHFLIKRSEITKESTNPTWGPDFQYIIPSDCIRVLEINGTQVWNWNPTPGWIKGDAFPMWKTEWGSTRRVIVTDVTSPLQVRYLAKLDATAASTLGLATPLFKELLTFWLASQWAETVTASDSLDQKVDLRFRALLSEARSLASQEGIPDPLQTKVWENSRL